MRTRNPAPIPAWQVVALAKCASTQPGAAALLAGDKGLIEPAAGWNPHAPTPADRTTSGSTAIVLASDLKRYATTATPQPFG